MSERTAYFTKEEYQAGVVWRRRRWMKIVSPAQPRLLRRFGRSTLPALLATTELAPVKPLTAGREIWRQAADQRGSMPRRVWRMRGRSARRGRGWRGSG